VQVVPSPVLAEPGGTLVLEDERDVIARGIFISVTDLRRKLMRCIKRYHKIAKPFQWSYADPARRIA
jgi:hypothetical protein